MKLYTEERLRNRLETYGFSPISIERLMSELTPIELPSDEEEEKNAISLTKNIQQHIGFNIGVEWLKEQFKTK